ncbi:MAG: histidine--tRNA ligase [Candidatus Bathyarchaeota archaeon]|nr:histidine--tRNA ligase [Candidatus Bathyarchaeota archaeon]MDD4325723.1 histidine--tRNA ligase [Candidatus Bathyarchaeota archaeon]MDI9577760.1 histidine--tRNA ligase [Thermoproteota archaeon]MDT8782919.1 histidine--tRNA ligase [Candidatus Bathyarchaeota archaeon]NLD66066.1 histidine--tRNA ligase [Thermoproteota archaeon]
MPSFQPVRGMRDLIGQEAQAFTYIVTKARKTANLYGFREVITPHVESLDLLSAKSGEEIRQRMFIFKDLGDRQVALRPEFTASIARLVTSNLKNEPKPLRLFSSGTVYRYDEPQRGRYREFWQSNFELIGSDKPEADAEIVLLTNFLMTNLGLKYYAFKIGSIGVIRGILNADGIDEKTQNNVLQLMDKKDLDSALKLVDSEKCRTTLKGLINIKGENWQETIEKMKSYLEYYDEAKIAVENLHLTLNLITESTNIKLTLEPAFARGLEYYTGMIFEVYIPQLDIALGGGGRYDRLIETFGGEPTPAVGCAHGIDRVALALQIQGTTFELTTEKRVVVIPITDAVRTQAFKIAQSLRLSGVAVEFEVMGRKMVKALEDADKRKIGFAVIVGERELKEDAVVLKDLVNRKQKQVTLKNLVEEIKN